MASKSTFLVLGVILAVVLLISSDVAARELAEHTKEEERTRLEISEDGRGGYNKIPSASVDGRGGYNKIP